MPVSARLHARAAAARSAVIMTRQVITEDHAVGHTLGTPWSRTSSWSRHITRVTARPPLERAGW